MSTTTTTTATDNLPPRLTDVELKAVVKDLNKKDKFEEDTGEVDSEAPRTKRSRTTPKIREPQEEPEGSESGAGTTASPKRHATLSRFFSVRTVGMKPEP